MYTIQAVHVKHFSAKKEKRKTIYYYIYFQKESLKCDDLKFVTSEYRISYELKPLINAS